MYKLYTIAAAGLALAGCAAAPPEATDDRARRL